MIMVMEVMATMLVITMRAIMLVVALIETACGQGLGQRVVSHHRIPRVPKPMELAKVAVGVIKVVGVTNPLQKALVREGWLGVEQCPQIQTPMLLPRMDLWYHETSHYLHPLTTHMQALVTVVKG